jgi:hypothetical protein
MRSLFEPVLFGPLVLKNRVFMPPLTRNRANVDGVPSELAVQCLPAWRKYSTNAVKALSSVAAKLRSQRTTDNHIFPSSDAYELLTAALDRYYEVHKTFPARVVIHKSSRFDDDEQQGCLAALNARRIATHDFLSITDSNTRLFRAGQYPPLCGTLLVLDDPEMVLYTRGSVPFFETYPGKYIPRPLRIRAEHTEQTPQYLAREILALTKMNWNNTQFDGSIPVTLRASRQCSSVLRYCSAARSIEPHYSYYV